MYKCSYRNYKINIKLTQTVGSQTIPLRVYSFMDADRLDEFIDLLKGDKYGK